ncbi:MAG: porin family protein [Alphaproteobacteria bacterium]|nr:porin family protein [Alphaproteobacteria bacterium]
MKKYILVLAAISFVSSATAQNGFYLKGGVGLNNIKTAKFSNHDFEGKVKLSDSFPLIEAGIGYKFDNGIRIESVIDYYFLFRTSEISTNPNQDIFKISGKTKADSLMFNIYKDIVTIGNFTPFVGGGIGIGHLKESAGGYAISRDDNVIYPLETISKKRNQFAYKLTIGSDIKLSNKVTGEISYNYFNLGSNKRKIIGGIQNIGNRTYEIHNITLGMRFAI